jgi:hypothetical protein
MSSGVLVWIAVAALAVGAGVVVSFLLWPR